MGYVIALAGVLAVLVELHGVGVTLVVVGFVDPATTPYFRRLGERLAGR